MISSGESEKFNEEETRRKLLNNPKIHDSNVKYLRRMKRFPTKATDPMKVAKIVFNFKKVESKQNKIKKAKLKQKLVI